MTNSIDQLAAQLRAAMDLVGEEAARAAFTVKAAALAPEDRARLEALVFGGAPGAVSVPTAGVVEVSGDARIYGPMVGVNYGQIIYGRDATEDERRRLGWYLDRLASTLTHLPLRGLDEKLDRGKISLSQIYVMLAVATRRIALAECAQPQLGAYFTDGDVRNPLKPEHHPDHALPDAAILGYSRAEVEHRFAPETSDPTGFSAGDRIAVWRAFLAAEVLQWHRERKQQPCMVLLGDPGSGKSTFVRHLAWAMAQRGRGDTSGAADLVGWDGARQWLPILLPLRKLAGRLAQAQPGENAVYAALRDEIRAQDVAQVDDMLSAALHHGAALLLFDGLDEVPLQAEPGKTADRQATAQVLRAFLERHSRATALLTCRTRAFGEPLRDELGWPVETLAPFTLGQIRHFVRAWYAELAACGQIEPAQAEQLTLQLLDTIQVRPALRTMAETPLLLTLMALVLFNRGELPRDRPQLYERILELLLGQWDKVRDGQSLAEAIGQKDWTSERVRPLLDQLSYDAHRSATSADGRGRLAQSAIRDALIRFFEQAGLPEPWAAAGRCMDYFSLRSGLIAPDTAQDSYVFAHLTLQEHCAGRALVLARDGVERVMAHRADDRWREPIFLGLGVVQQTNPWLIETLLRRLLDRAEGDVPKPTARWYRDLILAAEIGADRDWSYLRDQRVDIVTIQRDLRRGLVELLGDRTQPLPASERVRAGFLLGDLGDPRIPVTAGDWRRELGKARAGDTTGYLCRVEPGTYWIGSDDDDPDARDDEKPRHQVTFDTPFWIARYPVTNAQWQAWVEAGGAQSRFDDDAALNQPNQPVVGVAWDRVAAHCTWLSEQIGAEVRLPSEAEWEAAARGLAGRRYPWAAEWCDDHAATEEDQETRGSKLSVPVGCYPAGAAAESGALDMAGNVWEWTSDVWQSYPGAEKPFTVEYRRALRGGSYYESRTSVRCAARLWAHRDVRDIIFGFRVVVSLVSHVCSEF